MKVPTGLQWVVRWPAAFPASLGVLMLLGLAYVMRQRELIAHDAQTLLATANPDRIVAAAHRMPPSSRRRPRGTVMPTQDGFVGSALRHATDLEGGLSPEEADKMWRLIERLANGSVRAGAADRSLEARCILEADGDQQLRFEFLRLAGELETQAARTWLDEFVGRDEDNDR